MGGVKSLTCVVLVIAAVIGVLALGGESREASEAASTAATLDDIFAGLNAVIDRAEKTGDYVLAKAAVKAKDAIDAWRAANKELLTKAFRDVEAGSRENLGSALALLGDPNAATGKRLETAEQLTEIANQLVERLTESGRQVHILRFVPRIVPPQTTTTLTVRVRGVNLDKADPMLHLLSGPAERALTGPEEADFAVPIDAIPRDPSKLRVHTLNVTYTTPSDGFVAWLLGRRDSVSRQLPIVTLPVAVATFELTGTKTSTKRIEMPYAANPGQFRGNRERISKVATPPAPSEDGKVVWRWDLTKSLRVVQSRSVQGRCEGIDLGRSSETGITVVARVEAEPKTRQRPHGGPGWVDCTLMGTVYRVEQTSAPIDRQRLTLTWTKEASVDLPPGVEAELVANTFDGRTRRFTGSDTDKFFEVRREPNRFVIVPRVPEDVLIGD